MATRAISGLAVSTTLLLASCASEAPLRPPSLHLPAAVRGLAASRTGDAVDLTWTAPTLTTDGVPLTGKHAKGPFTAEICRDEAAAAPTCSPVGRVVSSPGSAAVFHDALPPGLDSGPARLLRYRVRMLNVDGKGANYTGVDTLAGAAPPPVRGLRTEVVTGGVVLSWQPDPRGADASVRIRVAHDGAPGPYPSAKTPQAKESLLAVEATGDPGRALDSSRIGEGAQHYTVFRVRTARFGAQTLSINGGAATATVAPGAKAAPPEPPTGLAAVVNTLGAPEIDLVWQPSAGAAGYRLYRSEGSGSPAPVTRDALTGFTFSDTAVKRGETYRYRVSAVNGQGTESNRSAEVSESVSR